MSPLLCGGSDEECGKPSHTTTYQNEGRVSTVFSVMEVNKEEAARCRDLGLDAMRAENYPKAIRMFSKSLHLYPLPGVQALLEQSERKMRSSGGGGNVGGGGGEDATENSSSNGDAAAGPTTSSNSSSNNSNNNNSNNNTNKGGLHRSASAPSAMPQSTTTSTGADGRSYTNAQVQLIAKVLKAKSTGGRGAHYRVLDLPSGSSSTESEIKKAYRSLALKLHPDKLSLIHI